MDGGDQDLVVETPSGLYCPQGDFHIDPWRAVDRAVITHAHGDHARRGSAAYLASERSEGVLRARLGQDISLTTLAWGQAVEHRGVRISLHPAGHVLGAAQVRLEHAGRVWVVSGDYYLSEHDERNPTCDPFEPVRGECFITESTFGLPVYRWRPQTAVFEEINLWWLANRQAGISSVLMAYSFGKAQRILAGVDAGIGPIVVHGSVEPLNEAYRRQGIRLPEVHRAAELGPQDLSRALVIAPPSVAGSPWLRRFGEHRDAFASGWMQLRGARRRRGVDRGFVLSDHADWPGLLRAIRASEAQRVIVTHGQEAVMVRWLRQQGLHAESFRTAFEGEGGGEEPAPAEDAHA